MNTENEKIRPMGMLAAAAGYSLPVEVYISAAGFYIGTASPELGPVSRESVEYWETAEEAIHALENGLWTQRYNH